jgi:hypothetical protein
MSMMALMKTVHHLFSRERAVVDVTPTHDDFSREVVLLSGDLDQYC